MSRYIPPPRHHRCRQAQLEAAPLTSSHYHCFSALDQVFDQAFPLLFLPPLCPVLGPSPRFRCSESRWGHGAGFPHLPCGPVIAAIPCPCISGGIVQRAVWMVVHKCGPVAHQMVETVCFDILRQILRRRSLCICASALRALLLLALCVHLQV